MDDKRYANLALILALVAFVFATLPITGPILAIFFDVQVKHYTTFESILGALMTLGWIPGLVIAIVAHKMGKHMKGSLLLINTTRILAALAMLGTLGFGILLILAMLLNHFAPRGY
jgi:hypothetical protein